MDTGLTKDDPVPSTLFVVEANSVALATLGVTGSNKALSMASLGIFGGVAPPPPPTPTPSGSVVNMSPMLLTVGKLM